MGREHSGLSQLEAATTIRSASLPYTIMLAFHPASHRKVLVLFPLPPLNFTAIGLALLSESAMH